jgi:hypothetical protein
VALRSHICTTTAPHDLTAVGRLAPHLRALTICAHKLADTPAVGDGASVGSSVVALFYLRRLAELQLPLQHRQDHFFSQCALRSLTQPTRLGLHLFYNRSEVPGHVPVMSQALVLALAAPCPTSPASTCPA